MTPPDPDHPLLTRFARGDSQALADLAARHEPALLGLARGLLSGHTALAEDAVQDTWLRVVKYAPKFEASFKGHSTVKTWLYRILINRCKDLRTAAARDHGSWVAQASPPVPGAARACPCPPDSPDDDPTLRAALDTLPGPTRLILLLCYHRGLTHDQAAAVLDIPTGTLKSRLHTALQTLRAALQTGDMP